MPQWKDKSDKTGQYDPETFRSLLNLLESPDPDTAEKIKIMIQDTLNTCKDYKFLNNLVDYYVATESKNSLEILLHVKEPHDKHIFEKIKEMMKNESTRYRALQFLGNIVYRQPSWLHKIASQRLLHTLLNVLKTDMNSTNLLSGLFILICLLPLIPYQFGSSLPDTFDIFSRLVAWNIKKPSNLSDILNLHLQTGVYSLFHRLYGMYPCNFLAYLRSFYGGRDCTEENYEVFSQAIKPMLERVRLHPLLVTASKETELNVNRWKKMAYHDIIVECASISLDSVEGSFDNKRISDHPEISRYENADSICISCLNNKTASADLQPIQNETSFQEHIWSPSQAVETSLSHSPNNIILPTNSNSEWDFNNVMQSSTEESIPLDFAVEAKPELLKSDVEISGKNEYEDGKKSDKSVDSGVNEVGIPSSLKQMPSQNSTDSDSLLMNSGKNSCAIKTKEDDIDKEVSELTSFHVSEQTIGDFRQDTPFCSTTQNLTDEPVNIINQNTISLSNQSDSLNKSVEDDTNEMCSSMQESDLQPFIPSFSRYRYFSHCGQPPNLAPIIKKPIAFRSISCPAKLCPLTSNDSTEFKTCNGADLVKTETSSMICDSSSTKGVFVPLKSESSVSSTEPLPVYKQLLPAVLSPLQCFEDPIMIGLQNTFTLNKVPKNLSPPELLDLYILHGNTYYLNHLPLTSRKDTDWTHFGGKPPAEEIDVLRNQILLLHNMLLFERHRKDIHSERNRRYLGRAKRTKMQEEYVEALKKEIFILTEENDNLKTELSRQHKTSELLKQERKKSENELEAKLFKLGQENTQLLFSNKQLQTLLVSQKEENDEIWNLYNKVQRDIANMQCQLQYASKEVQLCQRVKKEAIFLTKQLILLQELNSHYKSKIEQMKEPQQPDIKIKLMNTSMSSEITDLKQKLETKSVLLDASKGKLCELENMLSALKSKQTEKLSYYEKMKAYHQDEIMVREDRIADLQKVSIEKDAHILKLYSDIEELQEKIGQLQKKIPQRTSTTTVN